MSKNSSKSDEALTFAEESSPGKSTTREPKKKYKLLIVDDEQEVHVMTKLVLSDYCYKNTTLEFLSAHSGEEAKTMVIENPDIALILLDVVMESKTAGLDVARFIRKTHKNEKVRIILRTGQPGKAPEKDIILNYDINDYKEKTELTTQKLFTTVTTALRSFIHLEDLEEKTQQLAMKNARLNEEIARRLVAESNLAKYNRSLEKMIDSKSQRLKQAIQDLANKEQQLMKANSMAQIGNISISSITEIDTAGNDLKANMDIIDRYRQHLSQLLEKYEMFQSIITPSSGSRKNHDQKTNTVIHDIAQFKKEIHLDDILKHYPEIIKDSTKGIEYIAKAVNDLKQFISISDEPNKKANIQKLLQKIIKRTAKDYSPQINIQTDFEPVPNILISQDGFEMAFAEILKNAYEAVGSHGIISIDTLCEDTDILIHICDNGKGVPAKHQDQIFKPYFTTKTKKHRGLGLSFAKSVILSHNGSISVSSSPNQGTSITVKLAT